MKAKQIACSSMTLLVLLVTMIDTFGQRSTYNMALASANRAAISKETGTTIFYTNPLLLDNSPLNYDWFSMSSTGVLSLVVGNPETTVATKIPFRIYLKRKGQPINSGASNTNRSVFNMDIALVLAVAKPGDDLIIEPVRKEDWPAGRSILLSDYLSKATYNLFPFLRMRTGKDGC
jgi:hypothetical protein